MMEILRSAGERGTTGGIPAHHHNVEEWSNLDPFSGIREQKRVETDHWANNTRNSSHQYGKVVDSRARNLADGTREQMKQMKQLEVFQARVPGGGSVQVIRSHTSTTSSKISGHSWTNSSKMIDTSTPSFEPSSDFDNLKLSIMPLNLNTERTKVNLGRSGSLNKRRPPTRPRSLLCSNDEPSENLINTTASIPLEEPPKVSKPSKPVSAPKLRLAELATNADRIGTRYTTPTVKSIKSEMSKSSKTNVEKPVPSSTPYKSPTIVRNESLKSPKIFRSLITKRTTPAGGIDSSSDNEHRPLEAKKSVSSEDVSQDYGQDGGQGLDRSSAARRSLNLHKDYHWSSQHTNELENVFKKVLKNKTFYNRTDFDDDDNPPDERTQPLTTTKKSFVSAETIKNIRNNLKPVEDGVAKVAEVDVSIRSQGVMKNGDTVASGFNGEAAHVNNYNTGSLENKQNRNEEWYNRRKSYGFEQMKDLSDTHHTTGNSLKHIESSTDSGIAKSNEHIDSLLKKGMANPANDMFEVRRNSLSKNSKIYSTLMSLRDSNKKSDLENSATFSNTPITVDQFGDNRVNAGRELLNTPEYNGVSKTLKEAQNEPVCITIKPKEEYTSVINIPNKNEMKVESTMVEDGEYFRKVKEIYDKGAWVENGDNKKPKKVEFSKTEVHFEPGKVNIIETNEKPPPTNYRRRRKERLAEKQAERTEKSQAERPREKIPEIKFGDEIEKPVIALPYEPKVQEPIPHEEPVETNIEIVVDESEEDSKKPKSILKSAKIDETTNENIDQTKTDFKKILNSFKTSERQNSTGSPPVVDNGLKVRITSGNNQFDQRRASWCVPDNSNKFSTKINFGADNITILPQKTRYSYCEPSTRTIQSICSQSTNGQDDSPNVVTNNPLVSYTAPAVSSNHPSSSDEYSRFRTKSPLTNISKTTILNTNPLGSTSFFVNKQEIVMKSLSDNRHLENVPNRHSENVSRHLESVPRRNPEKSNEMSAILNRYSYTETSKSPIMSEQPTRFSYSEPANSSSEPIWYQHERQDLLNHNRQEKLIVRIGTQNSSHENHTTVSHIEPLFVKHVLNQEQSHHSEPSQKTPETHSVRKHNDNLKSTKLVLQANEKSSCEYSSTISNNSLTYLRNCYELLGNGKNKTGETFEKNRKEINSRTFLENVVAAPLDRNTNKVAPNDKSSSNTNNLRHAGNVCKSNSFPCSSKMGNNSTFPSYRRSYLIAIGAENEVHKDFHIKTYPRRRERSEMNVKVLELNKELPPRSPSKQFLSISFDNIIDGRLLKNNDLTEPLPLIVPLAENDLSHNNKLKQSSLSHSTTHDGTRFMGTDNKRVAHNKYALGHCQSLKQNNRTSYSSDTSTGSSLNLDLNNCCENKTLKSTNTFTKHVTNFDIEGKRLRQDASDNVENQCDNKIETVQNDLIPSVLSDLENLSKSIDEEIFDIPNKIKRRPSILNDDIYCLETTEKGSNNGYRRHKTCYKCNYDKDNNIENGPRSSKRHSTSSGKANKLFHLKSDEEYRKSSIKHFEPQVSEIEELKNKAKSKEKKDMKKIKSIEDLKINKLINAINENSQNIKRSQTNVENGNENLRFSTKNHKNEIVLDETMSTALNGNCTNRKVRSDNVSSKTISELNNELEKLTNEFKKNISSISTQSSTSNNITLTKIFSENEIYDLLNSEKVYKINGSNGDVQIINKISSNLSFGDDNISKCDPPLIIKTRCDTFKHDANNSKFKIIAKNGNHNCDNSAQTSDTQRTSLNSKTLAPLRNSRSKALGSSHVSDDAELSDDSLKADEEVRTLLMHSEDRLNNTEGQQWNASGGAGSLSITTNKSITTTTTTSNPTNTHQISTASTNKVKAKNQFSSTAITASNPTNKKEPLNDPPQVTSIALHYEPAKPKTFQPVCLIYKPESPTSKRIHDYENHKTETRNGTEEIRTHHKEKTAVVTTHIRQEKRSNRESNENIQKAQANKITNELKKINESIKLSSGKHLVNATRKTEKTLKEEPPKRPARKVKEEPIYEKIQYRSKKNSEVGKNDSLRLKNTKDQFSSRSSGRDSWLNIPKENGHCSRNTSKEVKPRSRDSSLESNHTLTNRSRTSSMSSNIRSRTSSLESNSQLHSAVLLKSRNGSNESGQRSRTSSIDSNRSTNLRNVSRNHSNTPTPVRSRTSSMESDRSYQGVTTRSRLTTTQNRHFTTSKTREHSKSSPITENKRCTKQLLESANKGVCLNEVSRKSKQYPARSVPSRSRQSSADSTIMEELTKAADEILLAVNGYTDEDSIRGSDDERNKKKSYKPLTTIVETPNRSVHSSRNPRKSDAPVVVRENIYSNVKSQRRSSNSSLETNEKPNSRTVKTSRVQENVYANIKPVKKSETGEKVKKKTSRMQRTSSREILESSSDDNSRDEIIKNKKMVRRSKVKTGNTITTNNVEVCTNKKLDKTVTPSKPRSSSVIRSVANHIIESVSPAPSSNDKDKHSTEKKTCLKTALFSKQSTNGTKASKRQESRGSSQSQKVSSMKSSSSSAKKK
uniref:Uncharacterized protein n=1 Tax=Cacopsylla melanoneura TaxID=428564 RepID=A0A8D8UZV1_9HEMI